MKKGLLFKVITVFLFSFLLLGGATYAQVTSSSINGLVTDEKGESLPGATVLAVHVPSGTQYGTVSTESGRYVFPNVRVGGPYRITVTYIGYSDYVKDGILAELGSPTIVNVRLSDGGTQLEEVTIVASPGSAFAGQRTGAATSVNAEQIRTLPTVSRSISDFTRLTPQANGNSFGGRDGRYNNFQVDGANFNNGFGLNDNPLPGGGGLSLDAIEEIQVNIAPFDVRQSGFSGAGINAVTKSGTNQFKGSVYGYFGSDNFQGNKVNGNEIVRAASKTQTYGFRLGGPIIKNKLFFFANYERRKSEGASTGAVNLWKATDQTNENGDGISNQDQYITRVKRSDLEAVRNHLINKWGYEPGAYEGYANDNSEVTNSFLARIDWNINKSNRLAVRFNQVESSTPSLVNGTSGAYPRSPGAFSRAGTINSIAFGNTMYFTKNIVRSITAELNTDISPRLSNQFLATYSRIQATRTSPSAEFPMIDIGYAGDNLRGSRTYQNYITAGYELFTYGNDVLNDNISITNNLTYTTGKHTFVGGIAFETQKFGNQYIRNGTSYYRYASVEEFLKTGTPEEVAPLQFALTYPYEGQDTYAPIRYGLPSLYIQDKIDVSDKLTVTAGIRAEMPLFMNELTPNLAVNELQLLGINGNPRTYNTGSWPKTRVMLSPRVGVRWDVKGDKSLVVRGGTGIFAGRVPFVWLTNMPSNLGVIQNTVEPGSYDASSGWINDIRFNPDKYHWLNNTPESAKDVFIKNPKAGLPGTVAIVDEDFKMPQIWRSSVGGDYKLPGTPFTITADVIYTKDLQSVYQFGANRKAATISMDNAGDNREFYPDRASYTYNDKIGANSVSVLSNTNKGSSVNATVGITMAPKKGIYGSLFYSHTTAKTTTDNLGSNASSAWGATANINNPNDLSLYSSINALPHRVVGALSYRISGEKKLATTFSLFYNGSHRGRFSYFYNGDINGDAINADLLYIPESASQMNFQDLTTGGVTFSVEEQRQAFDSYVNESKFLSAMKGGYADRNSGLLPWLNRFDFKFMHDIFVDKKSGNTFQFTIDVINVGNLINSAWGVQKQLVAGANTPLRLAKVSPEGVPTFTMNAIQVDGKTVLPSASNMFRDITSTSTTWSLLAGIRYSF